MRWWEHDDDALDDDYIYFDEDDEDCSQAHQTPPDALLMAGPIHATSRRGAIGTRWWAKLWVAAVESVYTDERLQRGRTYARNGSVHLLEIDRGSVFAQVQGSHLYPYCTTLQIKQLNDKTWAQLFQELRTQAVYAAKLLAGELPPEVESILQGLGVSLFPSHRTALSFGCSCPDYASPCKHAAAIYYLLAEQIDADPFILFHLLGRTRDQVLTALNIRRVGPSIRVSDSANSVSPDMAAVDTAPGILPLTLDDFWKAPDGYPDLTATATPDQPPLMAQHGEPPADLKHGLDLIYRAVAVQATNWLGQ